MFKLHIYLIQLDTKKVVREFFLYRVYKKIASKVHTVQNYGYQQQSTADMGLASGVHLNQILLSHVEFCK